MINNNKEITEQELWQYMRTRSVSIAFDLVVAILGQILLMGLTGFEIWGIVVWIQYLYAFIVLCQVIGWVFNMNYITNKKLRSFVSRYDILEVMSVYPIVLSYFK